jgi:DNA-binding transcriptional ArsR family regulator
MDDTFEQEIFRLHSRLCAGLADPKRILMLYQLAQKPQCVNEISQSLGISQPSASRHLRHLRERGLVVAERDAQSVIYSLPDQRIIEALDLLREILEDILANRVSLSRTVSATQPSTSDIQEQAS